MLKHIRDGVTADPAKVLSSDSITVRQLRMVVLTGTLEMTLAARRPLWGYFARLQ